MCLIGIHYRCDFDFVKKKTTQVDGKLFRDNNTMLKGAYWAILLLWFCNNRPVGITCVFQLASQSPLVLFHLLYRRRTGEDLPRIRGDAVVDLPYNNSSFLQLQSIQSKQSKT